MRSLLLPSLLLLLASACGGMVADSTDAGDAAASDAPSASDVVVKPDAMPPPLLDGGVCNDVALLGADVPLQGVPKDAPPTAVGDPPPQPGTYALESATIYTGPNGPSGTLAQTNVTIRIENDRSTWQVASSQDGKAVERRTYQLGKMGMGFSLTATCGGSDTSPVSFVPINSLGFALLAGSGKGTSLEVFRPMLK